MVRWWRWWRWAMAEGRGAAVDHLEGGQSVVDVFSLLAHFPPPSFLLSVASPPLLLVV